MGRGETAKRGDGERVAGDGAMVREMGKGARARVKEMR